MPQVSHKKQIAKNTIYLYLRMVIVMVVQLYTARVVLQVLGDEIMVFTTLLLEAF